MKFARVGEPLIGAGPVRVTPLASVTPHRMAAICHTAIACRTHRITGGAGGQVAGGILRLDPSRRHGNRKQRSCGERFQHVSSLLRGLLELVRPLTEAGMIP
jgi:hypothetical protein